MFPISFTSIFLRCTTCVQMASNVSSHVIITYLRFPCNTSVNYTMREILPSIYNKATSARISVEYSSPASLKEIFLSHVLTPRTFFPPKEKSLTDTYVYLLNKIPIKDATCVCRHLVMADVGCYLTLAHLSVKDHKITGQEFVIFKQLI